MSEWVCFNREDRIGRITFDRPKANAYDHAFMDQFLDAIALADADEAARVVVVDSANPKFFCAGADIDAFARQTTDQKRALAQKARAAAAGMEASEKIFIAAINGHALGGGLEIAMACDLRLGGEGSYLLGLPEVKLGLMPGNGGSQRLTRLVGLSRSLELTLAGENISPPEALRIGLLSRLYPASDHAAKVTEYALALADGPPRAFAAIKRGVRQGIELTLDEALQLEAELADTLYDTSDAQEGFRAYQEKRPPRFEGR